MLTLKCKNREKLSPHLYVATLFSQRLGLGLTVEKNAPGDGLFLGNQFLMPATEIDYWFEILTLRRENPGIQTARKDSSEPPSGSFTFMPPLVNRRILELSRQVGSPGLGSAVDGKLHVLFTHDVDSITFTEPISIFKTINPFLKDRRGRVAPFKALFKPREVLRVLGQVHRMETELGIRSWYFLMSEPYGFGNHAARYDIEWGIVKDFVAAILEQGGRIGLHGSFSAPKRGSYEEEARLVSELVGQNVVCHRNHYLAFDPQETWRQLESAGIRYDFSVGFADSIGFRTGLTGPYGLYDESQARMSSVQEIPLVLMDRQPYLDKPDQALDAVRMMLLEARDVGGYVSILSHLEFAVLDSGWMEYHRRLMELCVDLGADVGGDLPGLQDGRFGNGSVIARNGIEPTRKDPQVGEQFE